MRAGIAAFAVAISLVGALGARAYRIVGIDPRIWSSADEKLWSPSDPPPVFATGFETTSLDGVLQVSVSAPGGSYGPTGTLPFVFDPIADDPNSAKLFSAGVWDGSHVLINRATNDIPIGYTDDGWGTVRFSFPGANPRFFGFSLAQSGSNAAISVNDGALTVQSSFMFPTSNVRKGYVTILPDPGDKLSSVTITPSNGEAIAIDHILMPEPTCGALICGAGAVVLLQGHRRRRHVRGEGRKRILRNTPH